MKKINKVIINLFILLVFFFIVSCNDIDQEVNLEGKQVETVPPTSEDNTEKQEVIHPYEGNPSEHIDQVYTTDKVMSLTINGLLEEDKMDKLLGKLFEENISATFFLNEKQITSNPKIVNSLIEQGHTIETSIIHIKDLDEAGYEDIYREITDINQIIYEKTGRKPNFVRYKPWKKNIDLQLISAQLEMDAVIGHSIRPRDRDLKDDEQLNRYFRRSLSRGGIISLDAKDYPQILHSIDYIVEEAKSIDYSIIPLTSLVEFGETRKPFEEIEGYDLIKENLDYEDETPNVFYSLETEEKVVALTFDDYGSDKTVMEILNILEDYEIKSSFFLKAKNVQANPNLAKVILDAGHEIANHSYGHFRSTELTPEELQQDLILAHKIITEAIQEKPTMLFRPPFGNIDDEAAKVISAVGFHNIAMYDVSSYDWNPDYTVDDVINRVMNGVKPGSVIVMHILDEIKNIETLPIIIEKLREEGYSFVKMSEWFDDL